MLILLNPHAAIKSDLKCARDHKWNLVQQTIERKECDCVTFFKVNIMLDWLSHSSLANNFLHIKLQVVIAVYRLWRCESTGKIDDMGIASINEPYYKGRSYWFPRSDRINVTCIFPPLQPNPPSPPNNRTSFPSLAPAETPPTSEPSTLRPSYKPTTGMPSYRPTQHPTNVNETNEAETETDNLIDPLYANLTYGAIYTTDITKVTILNF